MLVSKESSMLSVIMPVYNAKEYVSGAIDSILGQSNGNLEIVIVDDRSTDGSAMICDEYSRRDNRVRVIYQDNHGLCHARNIGLDIAGVVHRLCRL